MSMMKPRYASRLISRPPAIFCGGATDSSWIRCRIGMAAVTSGWVIWVAIVSPQRARSEPAYQFSAVVGRRHGSGQLHAALPLGNGFDLNEVRRHNLYPVLTAPTETAFSERVELVKRADRSARAAGPRIFPVQALYADNLRYVMVATSEGVLTLRGTGSGFVSGAAFTSFSLP